MQLSDIQKLCLPSLIYLVFSTLSILGLFSRGFSINVVLLKILFAGVWTWFLNYLCQNGLSTVSWILVLMPFIIFFGVVLFVAELLIQYPDSR